MLRFSLPQHGHSRGLFNLNTSHVKVQLNSLDDQFQIRMNLNTSHVKVQLTKTSLYIGLSHLNTSHVKVQLKQI